MRTMIPTSDHPIVSPFSCHLVASRTEPLTQAVDELDSFEKGW
jgi:hypothetical protein